MRRARPPLVRMQHIDRELRNNRYPNCTRLAGHFEVSSKSIQRDIDFMRDMLQAPIEYDPRRKGYFYRETWNFDPAAVLDRQEAEALAATSRVLAQYRGTPWYEDVSSAIEKLRQYLPFSCSGDSLFDICSFDSPVPVPAVDQEKFSMIEQAIRHRLKVCMNYQSASRQVITRRTVHPYRLHYDQSGDFWYLIAWCEYRKAIRTFALSRAEHMVQTGDTFTIPATFRIDKYLEKNFNHTRGPETHNIAIRFTPYQSQWIREHRWHPSQHIREHEDGSLTLTLDVSALEAVKRWVLRYGAQAEVLEPPELRRMVKIEVSEMVLLYGNFAC